MLDNDEDLFSVEAHQKNQSDHKSSGLKPRNSLSQSQQGTENPIGQQYVLGESPPMISPHSSR